MGRIGQLSQLVSQYVANPAWAATRVPASAQTPDDEAIQRARVGERRVAVLKLEAL